MLICRWIRDITLRPIHIFFLLFLLSLLCTSTAKTGMELIRVRDHANTFLVDSSNLCFFNAADPASAHRTSSILIQISAKTSKIPVLTIRHSHAMFFPSSLCSAIGLETHLHVFGDIRDSWCRFQQYFQRGPNFLRGSNLCHDEFCSTPSLSYLTL